MAKISNYLFDIGSTRVKIFHNGEIHYLLSNNFNPELFDNSEQIYYSNVNPKFKDKLKHLKNWIDIGSMFEINTNYQWLGTDRKLAIYDIDDGIIVDFGTAITVDVVQHKKHIGGYIFLGFNKYFDEVRESFPHINFSENNNCDCEDNLPNSSACAIFCGFLAPIIFLLKELQEKYKIKIIVTGGDSNKFVNSVKNLNLEININNNLIFNNMIKILQKDQI